MCVMMVIQYGMEKVGTGTIGTCGTGQSPCLHLPDVRQIDYGTYIKFEKFCTLCGIILETWEQYRGDSYGQMSDVVKSNTKLSDKFWVRLERVWVLECRLLWDQQVAVYGYK